MKEKEIHLTTEEIDYLLKGTIHWEDILKRENAPFRKPMDKSLDTAAKTISKPRDFLANPPAEHQEMDIFSDFDYNPADDIDSYEEEQPFWSGAKVYILLSLTGTITLGTWAYFVFA